MCFSIFFLRTFFPVFPLKYVLCSSFLGFAFTSVNIVPSLAVIVVPSDAAAGAGGAAFASSFGAAGFAAAFAGAALAGAAAGALGASAAGGAAGYAAGLAGAAAGFAGAAAGFGGS